METFTNILEFLTYWLVDQYWFPVFLIGSGIFFTIYLGFPQIKYFKHGWRILSGRYVKDDTQGETTPFQALTTALSGTVGTGNIGGVALAIFLGGPAAIFWMWITAFFGMTTKFVEVTLAHKYREILPDGSISGGPMYYIENGLNMKWLAILFSICLLLMCIGTGNMPQISSIAVIMNDTFDIPKYVTGAILAILLWMVIIGGIKRIAQIASKLVPFMAFWYLVGSFAVIISNYENIIPSLQLIFIHVFTPAAAVGGFLGASVAAALTRGVNRGLYSNEAGQGSAPIAHAAAKTKESAREGAVALMGPFIDTIVVCTMTGLAILSTNVLNTTDFTGALLTREAFRSGFSFAPDIGSFIVNIAVLLFAYTTMVAWSYYGDRSIEYLVGPKAIKPYRWVYVFFNFLGAILPLTFVWNFGDIALSLMTIPNLIGVIFLTGTLKKITSDYFDRTHVPYKA